MNNYLVRTICKDLRDNIRRCCRCSTGNWCLMCLSTCIASLLPTSLVVQLLAFIEDDWASRETYELRHNVSITYSKQFACGVTAGPDNDFYDLDRRICGLGITVCCLEFVLGIFGIGVCVRSCMGTFDLKSCGFCYVCFIPPLSLIHGILSLICCLITAEFVSDHQQQQSNYGTSFFMFLSVGITTIVVSVTSVCWYLCAKICGSRLDYQHQISSDDADRETTHILQTEV